MLLSKLMEVIYPLQKRILTVLGDIKVFKYPFFMIYDPKSYRLNGKHFNTVKSKIKKFDVLLSRYDNFLDVGFIPGFWNHAGIYLGNTKQNGPVVHALSEGVLFQTLFDFMKADHICVLRPNFHFSREIVLNRVSKIVGKEYDFSFDFSNGDKLSCTEVIDYVFSGYDTKISRTVVFLGRKAIIPDNIYTGNFIKVVDIRQ